MEDSFECSKLTVHAEHSVAFRVAILFEPPVKVVTALGSGLLSMNVTTSLYVVNGKYHKVLLPASGALPTIML